jgi:hypothetical protein
LRATADHPACPNNGQQAALWHQAVKAASTNPERLFAGDMRLANYSQDTFGITEFIEYFGMFVLKTGNPGFAEIARHFFKNAAGRLHVERVVLLPF